jgi:hypothetical protein
MRKVVLYLERRGARSGRTGCASPGWRASPAPPGDTPTHNTATVYRKQPIVNRGGGSVADPDPSDPHVFGPPGSGSGSISRGMVPDPDPSIIKQK